MYRHPPRTPADRDAFIAHTRSLMIRAWPVVGLLIAGAVLLWWPLDRVIWPDDRALREAFSSFRLSIAALDVTLATIAMVPAARRRPMTVAGVAALLNLAIAGWYLAEIGQGDPVWLAYAFIAPQFSLLLLVPFAQRIATALAFAAVVWLAWAVNPLSAPESPEALSIASFLVFCAGLAIAFGHMLFAMIRDSFYLRLDLERLTAHLEERVSEQTEALRGQHQRAQAARIEQRRVLARELHDGLGQELTSLRLLAGISRQAPDPELLAEVDAQIGRIQDGLRSVLVTLRPRDLEDHGLAEALGLLGAELERRSGLSITVDAAPLPELPEATQLALYRIAQEALNNTIRHARARSVQVRLAREAQVIRLVIEDDGVGVQPGRLGAGMGTRSIQERAAELGGTATWSAPPGTCLTIALPPRSP